MAWSFFGSEDARTRTTNLKMTDEGERPIGDPPAPEGDGWEKDGAEMSIGYHQSAKLNLPKAREQRWFKPVVRTTGFCSRAGADRSPQYDYPF